MEEKNIFEQGSPMKTYLTLALPVMFSMLINIVYNIVDTYFVAQTQNTNLVAGVSLCGPIFTILMAFGNIFGQGGSSLISRLFGQKAIDDTKAVCSFCFYISIAIGVILTAIMLIFPNPLLSALGANADTLPYAKPYFLTMGVGAAFVILNFIPMNLLRAEGMSKESMFGSVGGLVINVILDPILISVMNLGAFGAALATVIGYAASDIFLTLILVKKSRILSVNPKLVGISGDYISQICAVGFSAAVTNWMSSLCMIITNHFLLPYGNDHIAAMGLAQKTAMIPLLIATSMVFGSAPMIGYYYGGQRYDYLKQLLIKIFSLIETVILILTAVFLIFAKPAISFFMKDPAVLAAGAPILRLQIVTMVLGVFVMFATVCFQASGKALEALIISLLRQGILFIAVIFVAAKLLGYNGVIGAQAITDVLTTIIVAVIYYKRFFATLK